MRCLLSFIILWISGVLISPMGWAETIYDNGPPLLDSGYPYSDLSFGQQVADDFVIDRQQATIRDVHWYGAYGGTTPSTEGFEIRIYPTDGDRPALDTYDVLTITQGPVRLVQPETTSVGPLYYYEAAVEPYAVTPGEQRWISIIENQNDASWLWVTTDGGNDRDAWRPLEPNEPWRIVLGEGADMAFRLTDDGNIVPEPASLVTMLLIGMAGLVAVQACRS